MTTRKPKTKDSSGFTAITAGIGPVMGGWLIEHASWWRRQRAKPHSYC